MCIAIVQKPGAEAELAELRESARCNPDGAGYSFVLFNRATNQNEVKTVKALKWAEIEKQYLKDWRRHGKSSPFLVHFRIASNGPVVYENCHPFPMADGGALIHNGIMPFACSKEENDTRKFVDMLNSLPPEWAENEQLVQIIQKGLAGNKVAMLWPTTEIMILNEASGHWKKDIWYSNNSYKLPSTQTSHPLGTQVYNGPWAQHTDGKYYPPSGMPRPPMGVYPVRPHVPIAERTTSIVVHDSVDDDAEDHSLVHQHVVVSHAIPASETPSTGKDTTSIVSNTMVPSPATGQQPLIPREYIEDESGHVVAVRFSRPQQDNLDVVDAIIAKADEALDDAKKQGRVDTNGDCPVCGEDLTKAWNRLHHDEETCRMLATHPLLNTSDVVGTTVPKKESELMRTESISETLARRARARQAQEISEIKRYPGGRRIVQYPDV